MNHEVQHHVHIQRAGREDGQAVRLEKHGPAQLRLNGQHRRIEALQVAGLQNAAAFVGARNQIVGFDERSCQRLFHQQVESRIEQHGRNRVMMHRGDGDCCCVKMKVGSQKLVNACEDGNSVLGCNLRGAGGVGLDGGDQSDRLACGFQFAIDAQVVLAKSSGSGNGNSQRDFAHSEAVHPCGGLFGCSAALLVRSFSWPLTAFRQRP